MRTVKFGKDGPSVSVIGQGTWYIEQAPKAAAIKALQHGIDVGASHIDTAEMYGNGAAEEVVGAAIAGRRDDVFLVSKVLPWNATYDGTIAACEASLRRLRTDVLDCYLLHWPGQHPLRETFSAMRDLKAAGKIRSYGVSNFDVDDLEDADTAAGEGALACNQVLYHLRQRAIEHAVIPWCEQHGTAVVGYSPFGHDEFPTAGDRGWPVLQEIAKRHQATERQIALAFLTRFSNVLLIPKAASAAHVAENAKAAELQLDEGDLEQLLAAFPLGRKPTSLPML